MEIYNVTYLRNVKDAIYTLPGADGLLRVLILKLQLPVVLR
jgi:hypothetical protein